MQISFITDFNLFGYFGCTSDFIGSASFLPHMNICLELDWGTDQSMGRASAEIRA